MNITSKVVGVTYEGRQTAIEKLAGNEPCRIIPEPSNPYDANALAVYVAQDGGIFQIGYLPRELAERVAPILDGEAVMVNILEITGGFEKWDGSRASFGVLISIELPPENEEMVF